MGERREIGVGVIGLGFMGRTHVESYARAAGAGFANRLVAVCDADEVRRLGEGGGGGNFDTGGGRGPQSQRRALGTPRLFDPAVVRGYASVGELLADDDVELVSVCTPTDTHVDLALAALAAGKHVLVEKPVALLAIDVRRVADAAREAARVCMPAMCVRFWPGWADLKAWIERPVRGAGALRSLSIQRLGMMPTWGEFYRDFKRSGGVLGDLHLHDTDFVTWCLGLPRAVFTTGSMMHLTTCYLYDGLHVTAEGGWDHRGEFVMQYTAEFEEATMSWVLGREPAMLMESDLALMDGESSELSGWDLEIRHLLDVIACGADQVATMEEAVETMRVIEAERRSLGMGRVVEMSEVD